MKNRPEIETWLNQDYTEAGIDSELRNLELKKHMEMMEYRERHTKQHGTGQ